MTNCYDEGQLRAYLDGELPAPERAALGAHLAGCAACQDQLGRQRALAARVRSLLPAPPAAPDATRRAGPAARGRRSNDAERSGIARFLCSKEQIHAIELFPVGPQPVAAGGAGAGCRRGQPAGAAAAARRRRRAAEHLPRAEASVCAGQPRAARSAQQAEFR